MQPDGSGCTQNIRYASACIGCLKPIYCCPSESCGVCCDPYLNLGWSVIFNFTSTRSTSRHNLQFWAHPTLLIRLAKMSRFLIKTLQKAFILMINIEHRSREMVARERMLTSLQKSPNQFFNELKAKERGTAIFIQRSLKKVMIKINLNTKSWIQIILNNNYKNQQKSLLTQ